MTFFVHPQLHGQWLAYPPPDLSTQRPWRVFFAGRAGQDYGTDTLGEKFGKMSRCQILQTLQTTLPPERLREVKVAADLLPDGAHHAFFVLVDTAQFKIPQTKWLDVLNRADFFLACPGMGMPLCHNLIESLSRGAVPILEHPEFLDPPLEPGVNCLSFHGRDELVKTFEQAFQFDQEWIHRLRQGAYAYYQKYLVPGAFAKRLLDSPYSPVELLLKAYRTPRQLELQKIAGQRQ